jgi:hypothetical protein
MLLYVAAACKGSAVVEFCRRRQRAGERVALLTYHIKSTAIRMSSFLDTSSPAPYATYGRLWTRFVAYCDNNGWPSLPATPASVVNYVGYLSRLGTATT